MIYSNFKKEEIIEVDLHGIRSEEAWSYLDYFVNNAPKSIKEIVVIHGYHNGNYLLDLVRKQYKNKRVRSKFLSINKGITSLILRLGGINMSLIGLKVIMACIITNLMMSIFRMMIMNMLCCFSMKRIFYNRISIMWLTAALPLTN